MLLTLTDLNQNSFPFSASRVGLFHFPSIMNTDQLCQRFGISKSTLNTWRKQKGLPYIKVGRTVRYDEEAVLEWFKNHQVSDRPER